jgi:hypothetical protein
VRAIIGGCVRWFIAAACLLRVMSCRVTGMEHYNPDGCQLMLANHPSLIDGVILVSLFPRLRCVIKGDVTQNPLHRIPARSANYISNSDPATLLSECVTTAVRGQFGLAFYACTFYNSAMVDDELYERIKRALIDQFEVNESLRKYSKTFARSGTSWTR